MRHFRAMRWDLDPVAFSIGPVSLRWYGLLFAFGMALSLRATLVYGSERGLEREKVEPLLMVMLVSGLTGSHLGHLVFYEPSSLLSDPLRLFQLGRGLSSHGAALGLIGGTLIYSRIRRLDFWAYIDLTMLSVMWTFPFVRLGNFANSEIVGNPTDVPWAVVFVRYSDQLPRHPVQLYEALECALLVVLGSWMHRRKRDALPAGVTFLVLLGVHFAARFLLEVFKEPLVLHDSPLTMGQLLSAGIVLGVALFLPRRLSSATA